MKHNSLRSFLGCSSPFPLGAMLALATAATTGCVTDPSNGEHFQAGNPTYFAGFAGAPGATVEVQVRNKSTNQWEVLSTTVSASNATVFGGRSVYHWNTTGTILQFNFPNTFCRLTPNCSVQLNATASVRVVELGSSLAEMVTFEADGLDCTVDGVNGGEDLFMSAWNCRSPGSPQLELVHH